MCHGQVDNDGCLGVELHVDQGGGCPSGVCKKPYICTIMQQLASHFYIRGPLPINDPALHVLNPFLWWSPPFHVSDNDIEG